MTLPLIQALAGRYGGAEIHLVVRKGLGSLFAPHPDIANVLEFDKRGANKGLPGALRMAAALSAYEFDLFVSAHASFRSGLIARLSRTAIRIGYADPWFNRMLYTRVVDRRFDALEEIERLLELAAPLGITGADPWPRLALDTRAAQKADAFWHKRIRHKTVGIHPGSVWPTKRWPAEHFARTVQMLLQDGHQVLVFAGPGETGVSAEVVRLSGGKDHPGLIDLSGALSLPELAAYLGRLDCYLTNDSGPMHLAWVQKTPVVALFGPTVRSLGFYPRGDTSVVMETGLACRPCGLHGGTTCPERHHRCMKEISPDAVHAAIHQILD